MIPDPDADFLPTLDDHEWDARYRARRRRSAIRKIARRVDRVLVGLAILGFVFILGRLVEAWAAGRFPQ